MKRPINLNIKGNIREIVSLKTYDGLNVSFPVSPKDDLDFWIKRHYETNTNTYDNEFLKGTKRRNYKFNEVIVRNEYGTTTIVYKYNEDDVWGTE